MTPLSPFNFRDVGIALVPSLVPPLEDSDSDKNITLPRNATSFAERYFAQLSN